MRDSKKGNVNKLTKLSGDGLRMQGNGMRVRGYWCCMCGAGMDDKIMFSNQSL